MITFVVLVYMTLWFIVGSYFKRNDVADIAWGLGFIVAALTPLILYGFDSWRTILVTSLVIIWGSRLSYHIFKRNIKKPEDARYAAWRAAWGKNVLIRSYFQIFVLQGVLLLLIAYPVLVINSNHGPLRVTMFDVIGTLVWIVGFFFESVGDYQLRKFIKNPENKGKLMTTGLWKYTRHPNYFGEVTQWWGIWIIALSVPGGGWAIIGPLTITFLILKVSGVPMLEKSMEKNPEFAEYKRKTSVFIPMQSKS